MIQLANETYNTFAEHTKLNTMIDIELSAVISDVQSNKYRYIEAEADSIVFSIQDALLREYARYN